MHAPPPWVESYGYKQVHFDPELYKSVLIRFEHCGTLIPRIAQEFMPFDSMLDVGAPGTTGFDAYVKEYKISPNVMHRLDIWPPGTNPPNFHLGDAFDAVKLFGPKSFDAVQSTDMVEHIAHERGEEILGVLETLARKFVVITTPCCFHDQDPAKAPGEAWAKNPYQKHISAWFPEDFTSRGYSILLNGGIGADGNVSVCGSQIIAWKKPC